MPNYYAHMVYGEAVYHALPEALQARIEPGMEAYILGLFGPDPFLFLMSGLQQARRVHRGPGKIPAQLYRQAVAEHWNMEQVFCATLHWTVRAIPMCCKTAVRSAAMLPLRRALTEC